MPSKVGDRIGSSRPVGTLSLVLFVPSADRFGEEFGDEMHELWVKEALATFGRLFGGATAYPRARGVWRDDQRDGELVFERPTIVFCYANPGDCTSSSWAALRMFLHRLGRETRQGEVGIVIGDEYHGITDFDD